MGLKKKILILGYGEMGHAMEFLLSAKHDVSVWSRTSRAILENEVAAAHIIIFCLPVNAHHEMIGRIAPYLEKDSLCLTIAKGLDESGRTAAHVFANTLSVQKRYGVLYGPMISEEILLGRYAFADVALLIPTDYPIIQNLFQGSKLVCRDAADIQGCSWSVILKNVYAIMFGICDGLKLGDNVRGHLMVTALSELSTLVKVFGGDAVTPLGYAGLQDLRSLKVLLRRLRKLLQAPKAQIAQ